MLCLYYFLGLHSFEIDQTFSFWEYLNLHSSVECRPLLMLTYFRAILMYYSARILLFLNMGMDTHTQMAVTQADSLHQLDNDTIQSYRLFGSRVQWQLVWTQASVFLAIVRNE